MNRKSCKMLQTLVCDILCLVAVHIPLPCLLLLATPNIQGFYCYDHGLMAPLMDETLESWMIVVGGVFIILVTVLSVEAYYTWQTKADDLTLDKRNKLNSFVHTAYTQLAVFLLGSGSCLSLIYMGQYSVGRLRPNFFAVCRPDLSLVNCTPSSSFIHTYVCLNDDKNAINNARRSFPSLHSAYSMYIMVYFLIYTSTRMRWKCLFHNILQLVVMASGFYCSLLPVVNYIHHWGDVVSGAIVGILSAVHVASILRSQARSRTKESQSDTAPRTASFRLRRCLRQDSRNSANVDAQPQPALSLRSSACQGVRSRGSPPCPTPGGQREIGDDQLDRISFHSAIQDRSGDNSRPIQMAVADE